MTTTMPPGVEEVAAEPADPGAVPSSLPLSSPLPPPPPVPIPVLAPYLGLVAAVLCTLGGGWLLLAPYALDLRHGAARLPRAATVDLETGAAIVAVGIAAALLFSANLVTRLRGGPAARPERVPEPKPELQPEPEPESEPAPEAPAEQPDPGGALRELLTPLVAALAADLRSHDKERRRDESGDEHRRQEP